MAIVVHNKHEIGDVVYLKTDMEQNPRIVVCIQIFMAGELLYKLVSGTIESNHYDIEITETKNILADVT